MALRYGEGRQLRMLPLDGAKVSVWDSKMFPLPYRGTDVGGVESTKASKEGVLLRVGDGGPTGPGRNTPVRSLLRGLNPFAANVRLFS